MPNSSVLLITPPFTQLNTPYPATAYLKGFLNTRDIQCMQADLGIEVILALFCRNGLEQLFHESEKHKQQFSENSRRIFHLRKEYLDTIDLVMQFLQGRNPTLAHIICEGNFLPEASRFHQAEDLEWAFGTMGVADKAKHLATLYLEDISDFIIETTDPHFGFSRYAERLGRSAYTFDALQLELNREYGLIDSIMFRILDEKIKTAQPSLIGFSVPFPGNLFGALRCGQWIKKHFPQIKIVMGGGFVNTELRSLNEPRFFKSTDFVTLDDGEAPLINLIEHLNGKREKEKLLRTFYCNGDQIVYSGGSDTKDIAQRDTGTPDYSGLPLDKYISVIEVTNPMHRLWSDGRWNKLTLAHGCYWGRCTFCDTSLDYIKRFEPNTIHLLCKRIETIVLQTGQHGFHFVDEAAPPALLKNLSIELIRRNLRIVWWANIRFEKNFTADLCRLMKEAGCIAVSGGLEVASDRILRMINKGVTVSQVAQVCNNFTQAGIMVHAYLMYGFPTQNEQETIDSLEIVRQLFQNGLVQSGFWHQFALTAHSPVGLNPMAFQIHIPNPHPGNFALNDLEYDDPAGCHHEKFGEGLSKSLFNFMNGIGYDFPLQDWFGFKIPATTVPHNFIEKAVKSRDDRVSPNALVLWLNALPEITYEVKSRKGKKGEKAILIVRSKKYDIPIRTTPAVGRWIMDILDRTSVYQGTTLNWSQLADEYQSHFNGPFPEIWGSKLFRDIREAGLIAV